MVRSASRQYDRYAVRSFLAMLRVGGMDDEIKRDWIIDFLGNRTSEALFRAFAMQAPIAIGRFLEKKDRRLSARLARWTRKTP